MARSLVRPAVPPPARLADALGRNDILAGLGVRIAMSNARLRALHTVLPAPLQTELRAGPIDDEGWTVLASNAAVAAKLRHLLPRLQSTLIEQGWPELPIRVRLKSR